MAVTYILRNIASDLTNESAFNFKLLPGTGTSDSITVSVLDESKDGAFYTEPGVPNSDTIADWNSQFDIEINATSAQEVDFGVALARINSSGVEQERTAFETISNLMSGDEIVSITPSFTGAALCGDRLAVIFRVTARQMGMTNSVTFEVNTVDNEVITPINEDTSGCADTGDNLLADDIESASEVSSPAIGQTHALLATDTESSSEVSSPSLSQIHALTADSIESTSEVSSPSIAIVTTITADSIESVSEVSTPDIGQVHALLSDSLESSSPAPTSDSAGEDVLLADDVESNSEITLPSLGQVHALLADNIESVSEVDNASLGQVHVFTPNSIESTSQVSVPTLAEFDGEHNLLADSIECQCEVSIPTLGIVGLTPVKRPRGVTVITRRKPKIIEEIEEIFEDIVEDMAQEVAQADTQSLSLQAALSPGVTLPKAQKSRIDNLLAKKGLTAKELLLIIS